MYIYCNNIDQILFAQNSRDFIVYLEMKGKKNYWPVFVRYSTTVHYPLVDTKVSRYQVDTRR